MIRSEGDHNVCTPLHVDVEDDPASWEEQSDGDAYYEVSGCLTVDIPNGPRKQPTEAQKLDEGVRSGTEGRGQAAFLTHLSTFQISTG